MSYDHVLASYADGKLHDYLNSLEPDCGECADNLKYCLFCTQNHGSCDCRFDVGNEAQWEWYLKRTPDYQDYTGAEYRQVCLTEFEEYRWVTCPVCNGGER